jgi:hypothetical protein
MMKARGFILVLLLRFTSSFGQTKKYPVCTETYFLDTKIISTQLCMDSSGHYGEAKAFNPKGKEIYSEKEQRYAGHAQTTFNFYPNGAVERASYKVIKQGGVHWTRITYFFTEKGKLISIKEEGTEDGN